MPGLLRVWAVGNITINRRPRGCCKRREAAKA